MQNGTMIQYFHWYLPHDGKLWKQLADEARKLADLGFTSVWLPPACKGAEGERSIGYDIYDLYDLGEFDQKGSVRTKYGTRPEYVAAVTNAREAGLQVIVDIVLNHKAGGDELEEISAVRVNPENRLEVLSEPQTVKAYTKYTFPGRGKAHSEFQWNASCFSGVDFVEGGDEPGIWSILNEHGEGWEEMVDDEKGNYDYLMFNDVEFRNPHVREELYKWGKWLHEVAPFDGVRLDAVKHISPKFYNEWLGRLRHSTGKELFAVGEYWAPGLLPLLLRYLDATENNMSLFDASLHHQFYKASKAGAEFDLTTIFHETLVAARPDKAVTVTDNHDTQPLQSLEAPVEAWFKPLAYALILLHEGGYPCVFYPDLYGAHYVDKGRDGEDHEIFLEPTAGLPHLLLARKNHAYGTQRSYFDHPACIGWTREGDSDHDGCAVVLSNGEEGFKKMEIGARYAGRTFRDALEWRAGEVVIDGDGWGEFHCGGGSVSVWIPAAT